MVGSFMQEFLLPFMSLLTRLLMQFLSPYIKALPDHRRSQLFHPVATCLEGFWEGRKFAFLSAFSRWAASKFEDARPTSGRGMHDLTKYMRARASESVRGMTAGE